MKLSAWRMVKEKHAANAFDGEGASKFGGRWNSPRTRIVYTSATLSLAALELLVHLNPRVPFRYTVFPIEFDEALLEKLSIPGLPADWHTSPPAPATMAMGDQWVREAKTALLAVPSAIVPHESNYLLNPLHPDFGKITVGKPETFSFDARLLS